MLRFGSALLRVSQHFGNKANGERRLSLTHQTKPGQRPSSLNGMNSVGAIIPGRLSQESERHNPRVGRSFSLARFEFEFRHAPIWRKKMIRKNYYSLRQVMAMLAAVAIFAMPVSVFTQTKISYHSNKYKPTDDVKVGRQAARKLNSRCRF